MTNFDKMEQNFVALTEEELMEVDGGGYPSSNRWNVCLESRYSGSRWSNSAFCWWNSIRILCKSTIIWLSLGRHPMMN